MVVRVLVIRSGLTEMVLTDKNVGFDRESCDLATRMKSSQHTTFKVCVCLTAVCDT